MPTSVVHAWELLRVVRKEFCFGVTLTVQLVVDRTLQKETGYVIIIETVEGKRVRTGNNGIDTVTQS